MTESRFVMRSTVQRPHVSWTATEATGAGEDHVVALIRARCSVQH